jgi:thymidylate synthase ThyX
MRTLEGLEGYAPSFPKEVWTDAERRLLTPFFSKLDGHVAVFRNLPPEITGAICARASRAKGSLLRVLLDEYLRPILGGNDRKLAGDLEYVIDFLTRSGFRTVLNNHRAQGLYAKLLSGYGDDSVAQLTGTHLVFGGISQVALKLWEDHRLGLEPSEQSTRFVDFSKKVGDRYRYYTPLPDIQRLRLVQKYRGVMDGLFRTYANLVPRFSAWLGEAYPDETPFVREKKALDTLRGLLPMATLGQVAFRGNGQAFEYAIAGFAEHELGELCWTATAAKHELDTEIPSLLLRLDKLEAVDYQKYLAGRKARMAKLLEGIRPLVTDHSEFNPEPSSVDLVYFTQYAELVLITAIFYSLPGIHQNWAELFAKAQMMSQGERDKIILEYASGRRERWYKSGKALEHIDLMFEIVMNIGAYRDLHRHRPQTQDRQDFSIHHGYDVPPILGEAGLDGEYSKALDSVHDLFLNLEADSPALAQYVVPLAYRVRFYQKQSLREALWEAVLRTTSQGHPDYRAIEQAKVAELLTAMPFLLPFFNHVDMHEYSFARRGEVERAGLREDRIVTGLQKATS